MAHEFASAVDANVCAGASCWSWTRRSVAFSERTFKTMATSSAGASLSLTAAMYVGASPAGVVWTLNVVASMYATRPLVGLVLQTTLPVATGARKVLSDFISGGNAAASPDSLKPPPPAELLPELAPSLGEPVLLFAPAGMAPSKPAPLSEPAELQPPAESIPSAISPVVRLQTFIVPVLLPLVRRCDGCRPAWPAAPSASSCPELAGQENRSITSP
jgi:hypothetical protein